MTNTAPSFFDQIDWQRPWLSHLHPAVQKIKIESDWRQGFNVASRLTGLCNHRGLAIQAVPQAALPKNMSYEAFISATGYVPTRENLHDFFNALVWLTFPRIKVQLNALQAAEIEKKQQQSTGEVRGRVRDGATIFDENAAILVSRNASLISDLRQHRWLDVFISQRASFQSDCEVWLFGHALMEKLVSPYKAITTHAWPILVPDEEFFSLPQIDKQAWIDRTVSAQLTKRVATSDFTPLPVLGVPGWWHAQDEDFYGDTTVFRPKRNGLNHPT